jgi:hypothetical protein
LTGEYIDTFIPPGSGGPDPLHSRGVRGPEVVGNPAPRARPGIRGPGPGWLRQAGQRDHENGGARGLFDWLLAACPHLPSHRAVHPAPLAAVYWMTQGPTEYCPSRPRY